MYKALCQHKLSKTLLYMQLSCYTCCYLSLMEKKLGSCFFAMNATLTLTISANVHNVYNGKFQILNAMCNFLYISCISTSFTPYTKECTKQITCRMLGYQINLNALSKKNVLHTYPRCFILQKTYLYFIFFVQSLLFRLFVDVFVF